MKTAKGMVVTMHYTLTDDEGEVIDSSQDREPLPYLHGYGNIVPGLEKALEGTEVGHKSKVTVTPAEGYGEHNPDAIIEAPRDQFPADVEIKPGVQVYAEGPQGPVTFTIIGETENGVKLDGNHPLAGMSLNFDVEIVDIRQASEEEIAHGHVHMPGHDHHH